jgi:RHS repeat-associated protein
MRPRLYSRVALVVTAAVVAWGLPALAGSPAQSASAAPAGTRADVSAITAAAPRDPVERTELRTRTSRTYANPDGSFSAVISPGSVNYRDDSGDWQTIENTLVPTSTPGYAWKNQANRYDLFLPPRAESAPVKASLGKDWVSFSLVGARGAASVSGPTADYGEVLPGVRLSYSAGNDLAKESLTLASPASPASFVYSVRTSPGITASINATGGIDFSGHSGPAFSAPPPLALDAAGAVAGPPLTGFALAPGPGNSVSLTVTVDPAWLARPERAWPVVLDPSVVLAPDRDCTINNTLGHTSLCTLATLRLGFSTSTSEKRRILLHFDVSGIPLASTVAQADLSLYLSAAAASATVAYGAHRLTKDWTNGADWFTTNGTTNWTTPGGDFSASVANSQNVSSAIGFKHWYLTSLSQDWVWRTQLNQGFILKQESESGTENNLTFVSTEDTDPTHSDKKPTLTVNYTKGLGEQHYYKLESQTLSDRMHIHVNAVTGNLVVHNHDLTVPGTAGMNLVVDRYYNNEESRESTDNGWRWSVGKDVSLTIYANGSVAYNGVSGTRLPFITNGNGTFVSPPATHADLTLSGGIYTLKFHQNEEKYKFNSSGQFTDDVDRNGNTIHLTYNPDGTLQKITDSQGRDTTFISNGSGFITQMTDSASRIYTYGYTGTNLTSYTDPNLKTTYYAYDVDDSLNQITTPGGRITKFTRVGGGSRKVASIIRVTNPGAGTGPTTNFAYTFGDTCSGTPNVQGKTVVTDPNVHATTYCWDGQGKVLKTTDALGHNRSNAYDSDSNVQDFMDGNQQHFLFDFDPTSHNLTRVALPNGAHADWTYNAPGGHNHSPDTSTDMQTNRVGYTYDTAGNLDKVTLPGPIIYDYDFSTVDGTLRQIKDAKGTITLYAYTGGNLTSIDHPAPLGDESFTYTTTISRLASRTDGKGQITSFSYDNLDRITKLVFAGGTSTCGSAVCYTYDDDGNLTQLVDPTGTYTFTFDELNRLTKKQFPGGTATCGSAICFTYDNASNLATVQDGSSTTTYGYDIVNRRTSLTEPGNFVTNYGYDNADRKTSITYPSGTGVVTTITRDNSGRITKIEAKKGSTVLSSYGYDYKLGTTDTGLRQKLTINASSVDPTADTVTYGYDALNRLTGATSAASTDYSYGFDVDSNITSRTAGGSTTTFTYNAANEMCWSYAGSSSNACASPPSGSTTYTFDNNGNLTGSSAGLSMAYNSKDQTTSITPPGGSATSFSYADATQDERTVKGSMAYLNTFLGVDKEGTTTYYRWSDEFTQPLALTSEIIGSSRYYYLVDGLGSVVGLVNSSGVLQNTYHYDPYGLTTSSTGTVVNPWRFAGAYFDTQTSLYKMGARYYDPSLMRWTQQDPDAGRLVDPVSMNRYLYAGCNPSSLTDPSGRGCAAGFFATVGLEAGIFVGFAIAGIILGPSSWPVLIPALVGLSEYVGEIGLTVTLTCYLFSWLDSL